MSLNRGVGLWGLALLIVGACSTPGGRVDASVHDSRDSRGDLGHSSDLLTDFWADSSIDAQEVVQDWLTHDARDARVDAEVTPDGSGHESVFHDTENVDITQEELAVLKEIFPQATAFEARTAMSIRYFEASGPSGLLGTAFAGARYGFNSEVVSITGIDLMGVSVALKVLSQFESWWYQVEWDSEFFSQFSGIDTSKVDEQSRSFGDYQVDAVSGATYSSEAVIGGFWEAVKQYKQLF